MKLKEFLKQNFDKNDIQRFVGYLGEKTTGTKDDLINRIISKYSPALKDILLKNNSRYTLEKIALNTKVSSKGTLAEISRRIINAIDFPESSDNNFHNIKIDHKNRKILKYNYDESFLLQKYFNKDELIDILHEINLPTTGDKNTLIERIIESKELKLEDILEEMSSEGIDNLCVELKIERKSFLFIKDDPKEDILSKIKELNKNYKSKNEILNKSDKLDPISKKFDVVKSFLEEYIFVNENKSSKHLEPELYSALIEKFGKTNVSKQVLIRRGRIDFEVFNIGIELKTIKEGFAGELDRMMGQIQKYKETFNENQILLIVNENLSSKEIEKYLKILRKEDIVVILKDY